MFSYFEKRLLAAFLCLSLVDLPLANHAQISPERIQPNIQSIQTEALIPCLLYMRQLWETVSLRTRSHFTPPIQQQHGDFDFSTLLKSTAPKYTQTIVMPFETAVFAFFISQGILVAHKNQKTPSHASQNDWIWVLKGSPSATELPTNLLKAWHGEIGVTRLQTTTPTPGFDYLQHLFQSLQEGKSTSYFLMEAIDFPATIQLNQARLSHFHSNSETTARQIHLLETLEDYLHRLSSPGIGGPATLTGDMSPLYLPLISSGEPHHIDLHTLLGLVDSSLRELITLLEQALDDIVPAGIDEYTYDLELLEIHNSCWNWLFKIISIYQKFPLFPPTVGRWIEEHFYRIPEQIQPDWMKLLLTLDSKTGEALALRELFRLIQPQHDPFLLRYSHRTPLWVWLGLAHAQHPRISEHIHDLFLSDDLSEIQKAIELIDALGKNTLSPPLHDKAIEHLIERKKTLYPQETRVGHRVSFWMRPDIGAERAQHLQLAKILLTHGDAATQEKVHHYLQGALGYYLDTHQMWIYSSPERWKGHTPEAIEKLQNAERRVLREPIFKLFEMFQQFSPNTSLDEQLLFFERCIRALPTQEGAVFETLRLENISDQYHVLLALFRANHPSREKALTSYWLRIDRTEGLIPLELLEAAALSGWKLAIKALTLNFSHSLEGLIQLQDYFYRGRALSAEEEQDRLIYLPEHLAFLSSTLIRLVSHPNQKTIQHHSGQFQALLDYLLQELTIDLNPTDKNLSYSIHRRLTAADLLLDLIPTIVAPIEKIQTTFREKTLPFNQIGVVVAWLLLNALPTQAADFGPHILNGTTWFMGSLLLFFLLGRMSYNTVISRAGAEVSGWIQRKLQSIVSKLSGKQMKMTIVFKESA